MQIEKNYKNTLPFQHHLPPILNYAHQLHSNNVCKKQSLIIPVNSPVASCLIINPSGILCYRCHPPCCFGPHLKQYTYRSFILLYNMFLLDSLPQRFPDQTSSPTHPTLFFVCFFNPWRFMCGAQIFSDGWSSFDWLIRTYT